MTTPNDQNRPKGPPGHPPDAPREPFVFSVPFGPSPRTPWDPLRTPQGPPGTPKATPRDHQGLSRTPRRRPRTPKGSPRTSQDPLRDPKEAHSGPVNLLKIIKAKHMYKQILSFRELHGSLRPSAGQWRVGGGREALTISKSTGV